MFDDQLPFSVRVLNKIRQNLTLLAKPTALSPLHWIVFLTTMVTIHKVVFKYKPPSHGVNPRDIATTSCPSAQMSQVRYLSTVHEEHGGLSTPTLPQSRTMCRTNLDYLFDADPVLLQFPRMQRS
jgi:hypothetical protein